MKTRNSPGLVDREYEPIHCFSVLSIQDLGVENCIFCRLLPFCFRKGGITVIFICILFRHSSACFNQECHGRESTLECYRPRARHQCRQSAAGVRLLAALVRTTMSIARPWTNILIHDDSLSSFNNSFVYSDSNLCSNGTQGDPSTQNACITIRGGAYNAFASTTQKRGESDQTASDTSPFPSTSIYSDVFVLNDQVELSDYTFGVPLADWGEQFYTPQAVLGLGRNSTFLNRLKSQGLIPSRTWSFYWGMTGRNQQSNGSMVFGGYDKSKVQGQNYTFKLNYTECKWGTTVEISELGLEFLDGKSVSLMEDTGIEWEEVALPLYGCLSPDVIGIFDMPYNNYFARFADLTKYDSFYDHGYGNGTIRSHDYNYWDLTYPAGDKG